MSRMVHKMKNDRNVSHYVSNDMKYSYWLVQENHLIRYWKITGIDDGIIHEDNSMKMSWRYDEDYIPSADVIAAMESCGSIDWAVKNKHITDDMALKIRSALKPLESHETTVSDNNMNASIPVNPFITNAPKPDMNHVEQHSMETLEPSWDDMMNREPGESLTEAMNGTGMDKYAYQKGINGERLTAKILEPLIDSDSNEFILHSVPLTDRMNIDHILVNRSGIFIINSKNYNKLTVNRDEIEYENKGIMKPVKETWIQTAARNAETVRGKLMAYGYDARMIPMHILFSIIGDLNMIRNPDIPAGCASIAFMEYRNIPKYIHSMDDERKIQLSSQLMRFIQIDMRRSSLFIMETSCLVHEEEC